MKGSTKIRVRPGKLQSLWHKSCSSSTIMVASALCFVTGWIRGHLASPTSSPGTPVITAHPITEMQGRVESLLTQNSSEGVRQPKEEVRRVLLPKYESYGHGDSGDAEVEYVQVQQLSWKPRAFIFRNFTDAARCDSIVALAKRSMYPSGLALREGEKMDDQKDVRTSTGTFLGGSQDPSGALGWVERKMARITGVPVEQGEAFNILRYVNKQQYQAHMDTFDPKEFGPQPTNRIASFLLYLTDVEEGGETVFPREDGQVRTERFDECVGLKVKPRKGDALLFWSMTPQRNIDPNSLHASCPIIKGEKWVATKWIRDG